MSAFAADEAGLFPGSMTALPIFQSYPFNRYRALFTNRFGEAADG